ncbi:PREDICTED: lymphocyte antigen 6E-like [Gavialis gangeticus]|uniref:lymphocyte antigen 6E-like n=1 Tax=Gavialis gangeticus TaxID=94835 RepID=UPI00092E66E0|nr:PREDICTED: lymphocyte antigen 6E-like [Gavialis gangeticus]XP_019383791.1 PREDICTED: lymphocyte antigen 6E-like [Gavialis gangeticus]
MKASLLALLAAVLCVDLGYSLHCYVCNEEPSNWNCMSSKACASHEKYCMTTFVSGGLGNEKSFRISKKCAADCSQTNVNFGVTAVSTNCCGTWLCNFSGASSVKTSFAVMAFGVLASFLCVLRVGL